MPTHRYIACDLGAESGRVMLGELADGKLTLEELHRFPTGATVIAGSMRWDLLRIYDELKAGLRKVAARGGPATDRSFKVDSVSTDSWGVDYALIRKDEPLLTSAFHYRDSRLDDGLEQAFKKISADDIFAETGIQFMAINTLCQLHADARLRPEVLKLAERFLTIGDYFHYLFCGVAKIDESLASTTQLYNPRTRKWSQKVIRALGIPEHIFPEVVPSGTVLGPLLPALATETGLAGVKVVATCSHDTGAAVAAVPAEGDGWAYLSSGTWSLLGIEAKAPIIDAKSRAHNFTNELGYGGSVRFLKNIVGLWIVQECRRAWALEGKEYSYEQLTKLAEEAPEGGALINPSDPRFGKPGDMPTKIADACRESKQKPPQGPGAIIRCALESLALSYRRCLDEIEDATGKKITKLHILGGGTKNLLLNQLAAAATGRTVIAGPVEATAIGNLLLQAVALGHLGSLAELRTVVRDSFPVSVYHASNPATSDAAYKRFTALP